MELVRLGDYGARHGVSRQAAAKWKARGYLALQGELVDVIASDERMRTAGKGRFNEGAMGAARRRPPATATPSQTATRAELRATTSEAVGVQDAVAGAARGRQVRGSVREVTEPLEVISVRPWSRRADEVTKSGVVAGVTYLGRRLPALAVEAAVRHGLPCASAEALFADLCLATARSAEVELQEEGIDPSFIETWADGPLFDAADWLRPSTLKAQLP